MSFRTELQNGVVLAYGSDSQGIVRLEYPSGESVETTWGQIAQLQTLVSQLTEAYESLLSLTHCQRQCPYLQVDLLSRLDRTINYATTPRPPESADG